MLSPQEGDNFVVGGRRWVRTYTPVRHTPWRGAVTFDAPHHVCWCGDASTSAMVKVSPKRVVALQTIPDRRPLKSDGKLRTSSNGVFGGALKAVGTIYEVNRYVQASAGAARRWMVTLCSVCTTALPRMEASDGSMQSNPCQFRRDQVTLITRVTPYAMAGHIVNTTVLAVALAGSVGPAQLIIWCVYSYLIALLLLYRRLKNRGRSPRSVQRAAKKAAIYAFFLALPWSSAAVLLLGTLSDNEERILVALAVGMAASGTVLLSAVPSAALIYMSAILIPFALKCAILNQKSYLLLGVLALSCWGFLAALIAKIAKGNQERQRTEQALAERNLQLALAGKAALVGSYAYDVGTDTMQISEGYAAVTAWPKGQRK